MPAFHSHFPATDESIGADVLVVPVATPVGDVLRRLAKITPGGADAVARAMDIGDFEPKAGSRLLVHTRGIERFPRVLLVGLGERSALTAAGVRAAFRDAAGEAIFKKIDSVAMFCCSDLGSGAVLARNVAGAVDGWLEGGYHWTAASESDHRAPGRFIFLAATRGAVARIDEGLAKGTALGDAVSFCRDLANAPPNLLGPDAFAGEVRKMAKATGLGVKVLAPAALKKERMEALLAVAGGAARGPRLVALEYDPGTGGQPVALVGKGLIYDSGGLSIKPAASLMEMKFDKSGGCAVIGAMQAIATLGLPVPVVGVVPAVENLISGEAYRPCDVIGSRSGKTIEVLNTDAEGRLVLADALDWVISRYEPQAVIDVATLTGAAYFALGDHACAVLGTDDRILKRLQEAGERAGERAWPLPLWEEYRKDLKTPNADVKNVGAWGAGTITGAAFLERFVGDVPWAHLDIAPVARNRRTPAKGATGFGVRLLVEALRAWPRPRRGKK